LSAEEIADFEVDVLAGFVMARASAGIADSTIRNDSNVRPGAENPVMSRDLHVLMDEAAEPVSS
jgi:hypothetical protein